MVVYAMVAQAMVAYATSVNLADDWHCGSAGLAVSL